MPESPEVRIIATWLKERVYKEGLKGAFLEKIESHDEKIAHHSPSAQIEDILVYGKRMAFALKASPWLQVHLRMTGDFMLNAKKARATLHTSLGPVNFVDPRRFGTFEYIESSKVQKGIGPDAFVSAHLALERVQQSKRILKSILLDQSVLSGLGNIWVDEALFDARLLPGRAMHSLGERERRRLERSATRVVQAAYKALTLNMSDASHGIRWSKRSLKNEAPKEARVHGRSHCPLCHGQIIKMKMAQRSTWFCPSCQL